MATKGQRTDSGEKNNDFNQRYGRPQVITLKAKSLFIFVIFLSAIPLAQSQQGEAIAYAERWYVKNERLGDDWVVEFSIPGDAQVRRVYCVGNAKQDGLFDKSDVSSQSSNGRKVVVVTAGWYARHRTKDVGDLGSWARSLRVSYAARFQPRGPSNTPRRP